MSGYPVPLRILDSDGKEEKRVPVLLPNQESEEAPEINEHTYFLTRYGPVNELCRDTAGKIEQVKRALLTHRFLD